MSRSRRGLSAAKLLLRSLTFNRGRTAAELAALLVSAAAATALLTLYLWIDAKLHREFRAFGANIIVTAQSAAQPLPADALTRVRHTLPNGALAVPYAYAVAQTSSGASIVVVGTELPEARRMNSWWQIAGHLPPDTRPAAALVGVRARRALGADRFALTYNGKVLDLQTAGTLATGDAEDSRVYLPLAAMEAWTGVGPSTIEVEGSGDAASVQALIQRLQLALPDARIHPVHQLVEAEAASPLPSTSIVEGPTPVHASIAASGRYTRLSSASPVVSVAAVCRSSTSPL